MIIIGHRLVLIPYLESADLAIYTLFGGYIQDTIFRSKNTTAIGSAKNEIIPIWGAILLIGNGLESGANV